MMRFPSGTTSSTFTRALRRRTAPSGGQQQQPGLPVHRGPRPLRPVGRRQRQPEADHGGLPDQRVGRRPRRQRLPVHQQRRQRRQPLGQKFPAPLPTSPPAPTAPSGTQRRRGDLPLHRRPAQLIPTKCSLRPPDRTGQGAAHVAPAHQADTEGCPDVPLRGRKIEL